MQNEIYERIYNSERDNWWYRGRRELVKYMVSRVKRRSEKEILDILDFGCGTGLNSLSLDQFGDVYGFDISEEALKYSKARGRAKILRAEAESLPFKSNSFDVVCALDVLEHIEDDIHAICEIHRVLKPGGFLILTVPAFMFLWSPHDEAVNHKRRYNAKLINQKINSVGFSTELCTHWNFCIFPAVAVVRPLRRILCRNRGGKGDYDLLDLPSSLNRVFLSILRLENTAIKMGLRLPFGVTVVSVSKKTP